MAASQDNANRIRREGTALDYEKEALDAVARSWEFEKDQPECMALALADAQVFATLHLAHVTAEAGGVSKPRDRQ